MGLQKYLPYEHYTLTTKLSPEEVRTRLAANIDPKKATAPNIFTANNLKPYKGEVYGNVFEMSRVMNYRNSFLPVIKGNISSYNGGTQIIIKMRPVTAVIIFMCFWLGAVGMACLGGILALLLLFGKILQHGFPPIALMPYGMFIFGYLLCTLGFKYESKISKEFLAKLLEGEEEED